MLNLASLPDDVLALIVYHAVAKKRRTGRENKARVATGAALACTCRRMNVSSNQAVRATNLVSGCIH